MVAQSPHACLLTRPRAQSLRFAASLGQRFGTRLRITISPLLAPEFLRPTLPEGPFDALILTSGTAVEALAGLGAGDLPRRAVCVGDRTADLARAAGLEAVSAQGDAAALVRLIGGAGAGRRLLHLAGEDRRGDIEGRLSALGIVVETVVVYRQVERPLSQAARDLLAADGALILPVFSPRSAGALSRQALRSRVAAALTVTALGPGVAEGVDPALRARILVAARPDAEAMCDAVAEAMATATGP